MRVVAILFIAHAAVTSTVSAQTLADVARKESERRQTVQGGAKTYTNTDLKPVAGAPTVEPTEPGDAAGPEAGGAATGSNPQADGDIDVKAPGDAANASGDTETKDQEYWSKRMDALKAQWERDQTYLAALQTRVDSLTADFVNRDDPAQRSQIANDRQKALGEIDRLKKAIEQDKAAIPELEEEARRAGVAAGWLR